jgi:Ca2+-binding EF-hand superfamily protein
MTGENVDSNCFKRDLTLKIQSALALDGSTKKVRAKLEQSDTNYDGHIETKALQDILLSLKLKDVLSTDIERYVRMLEKDSHGRVNY